nr:response regulator [Ramlibacter albus]
MTLDEVNAKPLDASRLGCLSAGDACSKAVEEYGYANEHERASVQLHVREDFFFRGDETAFVFVLFNLLKNALYYLPASPGLRIEVTVAGGEIRVRDTGPGIKPDVLARLFQPFRTSGKAGGTGLGLSYCRRVVAAFGGTIRCDSVEGSHTEFTLAFPVVAGEELRAKQAEATAQARRVFADRRVLVVEDDAAIRAATRLKLLELCCVVREAADGVEAMQALQSGTYDLVLADLNMPRMDGYELADALRSGRAPANRGTCLVAYTSEPPHLARVKTQSAGFDGFVSKPSDQATLVRVLCDAMAAREASRGRGKGWLSGRRFLLADDNAYNRAAVGGYLRHAGAQVVEVGSGDAALRELAGVDLFDVVLLDIHMPVLGGIETARAIRGADIAQSSVPLLAITAHADPALVAAGREAGFGDFILKPVEAPLLHEKLAMLMGVEPPQRAAPAAPPAPAGALLDENRLMGYVRIGMLDELVEEFLPEIDRLVDRLQDAVDSGDLQEAIDGLHSLVGMSGEAGAQALYRHARQTYIPMLEQHVWPASAEWLPRIRELAGQTGTALREWAAEARSRA